MKILREGVIYIDDQGEMTYVGFIVDAEGATDPTAVHRQLHTEMLRRVVLCAKKIYQAAQPKQTDESVDLPKERVM